MSHLKPFKEISKNNVDIAGGKGASLGEMTQAGIPVPPGFVILADAFDRFVEEAGIKQEIDARIAEVSPGDVNSVDRVSNILRDVIRDAVMPDDLAQEILEAFDQLAGNTPLAPLKGGESTPEFFVAVRSSATAEDGAVASWAGELETYLNTTLEHVLVRVKECWSSLFTPRAIFYRFEKNMHDQYVSVAVVIQQMVQSEISGVAFTVHPVTEDRDQMIIEAGLGLGEAIVSGQITPDSYVVSKSEMIILDINVGHQNQKLIRTPVGTGRDLSPTGRDLSPSGGTHKQNEWIELHEEGQKQKLTGKQIMQLAEMCKKIEAHYGFPCDIEWAMDSAGDLYITQSRPITTLKL
ncbi:MAG: hypothetical protein HYV41_00180 [Candidatus Magasanikbacteria bacterium]|nr:hypothetical protein [Candidatus Magasanikbacteria bacterium]